MPTGSDLKRVQLDCVKHLNGDTHIEADKFLEMKGRMYSFIRTHMAMRSGEVYERRFETVDAACTPPPCHDEMMKRKALFGHIKSMHPELQNTSDRDFYRLLFQPTRRTAA